MTPRELRELWSDVAAHGFELPTVEFYGHTSCRPHPYFSNFFEHPAFEFTVPDSCGAAELVASGREPTVFVTFGEKAIMLCKASVMRDYDMFDAIKGATNPRKAKGLGRQVSPWDQGTWDRVVCDVAVAVVHQKFQGVPSLAPALLSTGNRVIAEMTRNDTNWGTGLDVGHADASRPRNWRGTNILGWALMVARARLCHEAHGHAATAAPAAAPEPVHQSAAGADDTSFDNLANEEAADDVPRSPRGKSRSNRVDRKCAKKRMARVQHEGWG